MLKAQLLIFYTSSTPPLSHIPNFVFFIFKFCYFMSMSYTYLHSSYWSYNFFVFYMRTKEQPHLINSYSSSTRSLKLYQIQFVTLFIHRSPPYSVTFPNVLKLRKENGRLRVNLYQLV